MSDFWDYRGWARSEEHNNWQDIQGDNLEYRADGLLNLAINNGLGKDKLAKTIVYLAAARDLNKQIGRLPELLHCLLLLGDCYLKLEQADDVTEVALEAQKVALESFNDSARAKAVHLQGYNYFVAKQFNTAAELSMTAGQLYQAAGEFQDAADTFMGAGRLFRRHNDRARAIEAFQAAVEAAQAEDNLDRIVQAKSWLIGTQLRVTPVIDIEEAKITISRIHDQMQISKWRESTQLTFDSARAWLNVQINPIEAAKFFDEWLEEARDKKYTLDSAEAMLGRAYALGQFERSEKYVESLRSLLSVMEEIETTIHVLDVVEPLAGFYREHGQFDEAEQIWVRGRAIAEQKSENRKTLAYFDQMIALCIADYAEPERALVALESTLPKTNETPLPFEFEFALAKLYAKTNRSTESLIVIDRALRNMGEEANGAIEYAELHELKCDLLAKEGNLEAAKNEAKLSFAAYLELNEFEKAKRLNSTYLKAQPGDANPETGAITLGNWG